MLQRRGFLQIFGATAAAVGLTRYAEPFVSIAPRHEWIEDRGDFLIIRVPDGKTFAREVIDKPAILFLGANAIAHTLQFRSYLNVDVQPLGMLRDSDINASARTTEQRRATMRIRGQGGRFESLSVTAGSHDTYCMEFEPETQWMTVTHVYAPVLLAGT